MEDNNKKNVLSYWNGIKKSTNVRLSHLALIMEDDLNELLDINTCGQKEVSHKDIFKLEDNDKVNDFISLVSFLFLQFSFAINLQLHIRHATIFFLNHIRQIACDILLHATYYTYDVDTIYIQYVCIFHRFIFVQQIVYTTTCVIKWKYFFMICVHFQTSHLMTCGT
jgi:hypothetical protein